jgi:hypothetical protein
MSEYYTNPAATPATTASGELGWEDEINDDFVELQPGTYQFRITKLARGRHSGADWMPPCNKVEVEIEIIEPMTGIPVSIRDTLYLHQKGKWKICKFFEAIGLKKKGENLRMSWNIIGKTGMCETVLKEGNRGGKFANVKSYIPAEDVQNRAPQPVQPAQPQQAAPQTYQAPQNPTPGWNPGAF